LPALIRKAHEGKHRGDTALPVWGSGRARREFLYVDDLATACVYFMQKSLAEHAPSGASANTATGGQPLPLINIGSGSDLTIAKLAQTVMQVIGFSGQLSFDTSKPDGTPQKLLDVSRATQLGWKASMPLRDGIARAYQDFLARGISA
jgi:GDP-L-fucose synthase